MSDRQLDDLEGRLFLGYLLLMVRGYLKCALVLLIAQAKCEINTYKSSN
jgi:hypothetical protein